MDRRARDALAATIEDFWAGRITNHDFERLEPQSDDRGVGAVAAYIWLLYDDFKDEKISSEIREEVYVRDCVTRCIQFLRSDEEYVWPHYWKHYIFGGAYPKWKVILSFGLLGIKNKIAETYCREMAEVGDVSAWPFVR